MNQGRLFWLAMWGLVLATLWIYLLLIRAEVLELKEKTNNLQMERDILLTRHNILIEEQEKLHISLKDRQERLKVLEGKVAEFKVIQGAWESLHHECLDSLNRCVDSYKNATKGKLDWYSNKS